MPTDNELDAIFDGDLTEDEQKRLDEYLASNPDVDAEIDLLFGA